MEEKNFTPEQEQELVRFVARSIKKNRDTSDLNNFPILEVAQNVVNYLNAISLVVPITYQVWRVTHQEWSKKIGEKMKMTGNSRVVDIIVDEILEKAFSLLGMKYPPAIKQ